MTNPRYFLRIPIADSADDAMDLLEATAGVPVLHTRPGGDVVGIVEIDVMETSDE